MISLESVSHFQVHSQHPTFPKMLYYFVGEKEKALVIIALGARRCEDVQRIRIYIKF